MIKLLVDGVFYQFANTGIARVWKSMLPILAETDEFEIYFLDRGNAPKIPKIKYIPFPTHRAADGPADSKLIQEVCDHYKIDIFTSTYYTTPLQTPMVLMIYDMIPELFNFDLKQRMWMEKDTAINYALRYMCISENTRSDLLKLYPGIPAKKVSRAYCGVDIEQFQQRGHEEIRAFRKNLGLSKPYFLFVGSRVQHLGYKNSGLFFKALRQFKRSKFDVLCVGGEKEIDPELKTIMPRGMQCSRVELTDEELSLAYGGALALVYPSLYEGFGMPVIEAMACGCAVITTAKGSLKEAAGDAALFISGKDVEEMGCALQQIQNLDFRNDLKRRGLEHVQQFRWRNFAKEFAESIKLCVSDKNSGNYKNFFSEWSRLRLIQAEVNYDKQ